MLRLENVELFSIKEEEGKKKKEEEEKRNFLWEIGEVKASQVVQW